MGSLLETLLEGVKSSSGGTEKIGSQQSRPSWQCIRSGSPSRSLALKGCIPSIEPALRVLTLAIGAAVVVPMVRRKQINCEELFACALHHGF
jgi:hypothetical protein